MLKFVACVLVAIQITSAFHLDLDKRSKITDKGEYVLICKHQPIDLGIVLDSSSSISASDFKKGLKFLQNFLKEFSIGDGRNEVRVSVITFGKGIYPDDGFNLDTYNTYEEIKEAVGKIPHEAGLYTSTGEGIEYMDNTQMAIARPYAEKVSLVITDGNSQEWKKTAKAAAEARNDGIKIFALGIGNARYEELLRISGDENRIIQVESYTALENITKKLANETCIRKNKPTTTPPPPTECGVEYPADINFVFSPTDLGLDATYWATNFISMVVENEDMQKGFQFGAVTGSCPDDEGFPLNEYETADQIKERLFDYERHRLPQLVERTLDHSFSADAGGRPEADDIAVIIIGEETQEQIEEMINRLEENGIAVVIADPYETGYSFANAVTLPGPGARDSATHFVELLCSEI